eukprot:371660-Hanusia_phi.AAC.1
MITEQLPVIQTQHLYFIAAQPVSAHQQTFITRAAVSLSDCEKTSNATPTGRETATMTDEFDL